MINTSIHQSINQSYKATSSPVIQKSTKHCKKSSKRDSLCRNFSLHFVDFHTAVLAVRLALEWLINWFTVHNELQRTHTVHTSGGGRSSTKLSGKTPTFPPSSPFHQPTSSRLISTTLMTSPICSDSSSGYSATYEYTTRARSGKKICHY